MGVDKKIKKFLRDAIRVAPKISDKGEVFELRNGLVSPYPQTRKDAIRKIIQQMTSGKDVSSLFPDVLKNIATQDIEQKKLVYLYVANYAETHPELCILVVNTFVSDAADPNPLIRSMAIRTMSMIRVDKIMEYIETPLRKTLADDNPYVRRTAVLCVAKLFQLNPELCHELGVLNDLQSALSDENPMVVANALAALHEINELDPGCIDVKKLVSENVRRFLNVLNECTEWARITILESLSEHKSVDPMESREIVDRVVPHLQHVNPSVVLISVKCILMHLSNLNTVPESLYNKLSTALVSLMSTPVEIQYVALRNIRIILDAFPDLLKKELRIFYVKFNDPLYVKIEKLDILIRLLPADNMKQCQMLFNELKEYAKDFDHEFVTKAIQSISQLAIKVSNGGEDTHDKFLNTVMEEFISIIQDREEFRDISMICIGDLLRYDSDSNLIDNASRAQLVAIISSWQDIETVFTSDLGSCNYIWFITNYTSESLETKLQPLVEIFEDLGTLTQMALLMGAVKCHNSVSGSFLENILQLCTTDVHDLDIRDMAMMYWRCLSIENGDQVINQLFDRHEIPKLHSTLDHFSPEMLKSLLQELSTLSSVYFKPISQLQHRSNDVHIIKNKNLDELKGMATNEILKNQNDDVLLDMGNDSGTRSTGVLDELNDLFDITGDMGKVNISQNKNNNNNTSSSHATDLLDLM
ncbi:unnamed protein product [Kluyveromyces dobzhanskii CBS 2104]|uniref:AP complex subunit beta n=1 Tax=Kluyveromyces dobzhanskii CBS 2104 TaxID=1427455 RepID=A0A0A8LAH5_9SACH|nr:unnamed protein product [Kluyveromyces dobzhanskii CBS 2104]